MCVHKHIKTKQNVLLEKNSHLVITELDFGEVYKYLEQDESVVYNQELSKERFCKEDIEGIKKSGIQDFLISTKLYHIMHL